MTPIDLLRYCLSPCLPWFVACLSTLIVSSLPGIVTAQQQTPTSQGAPYVMIPPFENVSSVKSMVTYEAATSANPDRPKRRFHVDRYTEAPRGILEDILVQFGVRVVERQRLDALLLEKDFQVFSGLVDEGKAIALGKHLGATAIIMGTILEVTSTTREFSGYGVKTKNVLVQASVRVRTVDVSTGDIVFSRIVEGTSTYSASRFGGIKNSDVAYTVIKAAIEKLRGDESFKTAALGEKSSKPPVVAKTAGEIEVEFAPKPDNSDIEIDGKYVGGSPIKRRLQVGKEVKVRISKAGYKSWEGTIVPEAGLKITADLESEPRGR